MHKSMTFNGIRKPWLYLLEGRKKSPFVPVRNNLIKATIMPGAYVTSKEVDVIYIEQPIGFVVKDDEHEIRIIDELASWLSTTEAVPLEFDDEPGRIYYAEIEGSIEDYTKFAKQRSGVITFVCANPYSYSKEEKTITIDGPTLINNEGNEPADPIIELTATKKATFAMVNNLDDEYNLLGYPLEEEGHDEVVEEKPVVLYEDGTSLDGWVTSGVAVDDYFNDISGTMTTDGAGIRANNYGTGDRMHGPARIKTLPNSIQDFEIKTNFDIISRRVLDNFRIEVYLFDEGMNMIGKLGVKDNSRTQNRRAALGRVGEYRGAGPKNGYAIGKHNYIQDNLGETTLMHMSVKREDNLWTFYVGRWKQGRHQNTLTSTYRDSANNFGGKLRYVQLFIGNYQDRSSPNRLRMNSLEVCEIRQLTVNQTPYVIEVGDEVILDHEMESVFVNGEDYMPLRVFGSEFFQMRKGYNQIEINPPDTFTGQIRFREKYK